MLELEIFHKSKTGIFDEASYDEEGVITEFNSLPTKIEVSPTPTLRIHNIHPKSQILGDLKKKPKKIFEALHRDEVEFNACKEELLQFKLQTGPISGLLLQQSEDVAAAKLLWTSIAGSKSTAGLWFQFHEYQNPH
ncbi:hypothetical protein Tco_1041455 [Tanacetum coccineum]|uniref:Uncharacterized protein n=1 Tax=Tanacetum coccineum TaxID=301880 RepID=A0ABQ5GHP2_9ASTR